MVTRRRSNITRTWRANDFCWYRETYRHRWREYGCAFNHLINNHSGVRSQFLFWFEKGIQKLSDVNVWLSFLLLGFVFIVGPTVFIMETTITSFGNMLRDFFHMATWMEPFGGIKGRKETNFPQDWTIFYWSWWLVYAPFIGLFIARISKGRRLKEVILGTIIYGTLGCLLFFGIFGNYAVYLQITGEFNVINFLNSHGTEATIIQVMHQLPFSSLIVVLFLISAFLFLATTFDSGSYILAAASQKSYWRAIKG